MPWDEIDASQKDFRSFINADGSSSQFRAGVTTRSMITALLGPPKFVSDDGRAIGYTFDMAEGLYVWPLCFGAYDARTDSHAVRFDFDEHDYLTKFETNHATDARFPLDPSRYSMVAKAMWKLREISPRLSEKTSKPGLDGK